jgi:PAS domain S-box-containing protein
MSSSRSKDCRSNWLFRQLEEKESIINGISDAIMLLDAENYEILDVNQAFLNLYKVSRDQVIGNTCHEITHHLPQPCSQLSDHDPCPLEKSVSTGDLSQVEHVHKDRDGNDLYIEINSYPIKNAHGEVDRIIHLSRDVTDRRRAEEALREGSEKIKLFAYSVAHDLKSPTVGINGLAKRLHQNYKNVLDEKGQEYCEQILKASEQIVALVDKINIFIATKELPLRIEGINLMEITEMIRGEFSSQLQRRDIRWLGPKQIAQIRADRLSVLRLLRNLVDNALKYGGKELSEIKIAYEESEEFHILSVEDDGAGLREEQPEKVFAPFKRKGSIEGIDGVGLGLAIVKEIAEQHGGKVWTKSGKDRGTSMYIAILKNLEISGAQSQTIHMKDNYQQIQ